MNQKTTENSERHFRSLNDIRQYKDELREQIKRDEEYIADKWDDLFHREEEPANSKAQRFARILSLGTGVFDGAMLGWKLYRKYQEGAFLFGKKNKRK